MTAKRLGCDCDRVRKGQPFDPAKDCAARNCA